MWINEVQMWADCLAYDWVHFCDIFGNAFSIPKNIYYMPFDVVMILRENGVNVDINREGLVGVSDIDGQKHNALFDAKITKMIYEKYRL